MNESKIGTPLAFQVFILIVMFVCNVAGTNPKSQQDTCLNNCGMHRNETTHANVKAKLDKFFNIVGVPCPPPGFLHLVCDHNIGINLSCDSRAYIMEFCNRSNAKTYTRDESFLECETRCPESVCMQMFLFKKLKLSHNSVNTSGSINMMHHKGCFFQEQFDNVTGSTADTTAHVKKEPFKIGLIVICLTVSSLTLIVYLAHVIYLYKSRINKLSKRYSSQAKELETEFSTEESNNTTVRSASWTPRMQDRRSFPVYDKLRYIDSEET